jgi:hypothetical protein
MPIKMPDAAFLLLSGLLAYGAAIKNKPMMATATVSPACSIKT